MSRNHPIRQTADFIPSNMVVLFCKQKFWQPGRKREEREEGFEIQP